MKNVNRISRIHAAAARRASLVFSKEGPLLPRLLTFKWKSTEYLEDKIRSEYQ